MTSLFKAMQQLEQGLLRKQATLQEVMPGAQPMVMPPPDDPAQWVLPQDSSLVRMRSRKPSSRRQEGPTDAMGTESHRRHAEWQT